MVYLGTDVIGSSVRLAVRGGWMWLGPGLVLSGGSGHVGSGGNRNLYSLPLLDVGRPRVTLAVYADIRRFSLKQKPLVIQWNPPKKDLLLSRTVHFIQFPFVTSHLQNSVGCDSPIFTGSTFPGGSLRFNNWSRSTLINPYRRDEGRPQLGRSLLGTEGGGLRHREGGRVCGGLP